MLRHEMFMISMTLSGACTKAYPNRMDDGRTQRNTFTPSLCTPRALLIIVWKSTAAAPSGFSVGKIDVAYVGV